MLSLVKGFQYNSFGTLKPPLSDGFSLMKMSTLGLSNVNFEERQSKRRRLNGARDVEGICSNGTDEVFVEAHRLDSWFYSAFDDIESGSGLLPGDRVRKSAEEDADDAEQVCFGMVSLQRGTPNCIFRILTLER